MKAMKKLWLTAAVAALALTGCQEEQFKGRTSSDNYYASVETFGTGTKTALGEGRSVVWSEEDLIVIFEGSGRGQAYQILDSYVGKSSGEFVLVEGLATEGSGSALEGTVAVYPFSEDLTVTSGDNGNYTIEGIKFPSEQKYTAGSFSDDAFPMVAVTTEDSRNLSFKNIGGVLKLSLAGIYSVSQITLTGNSGEILSGSAAVTLGPNGIPSVTISNDASTSVSLICNPAVQLDPQKATDFYISIPPTEFEAGFKVTILDEEVKEHGLATHRSYSVERSAILAMPETTLESLDDIELTADMFCSLDFTEGWTETRFGGDGTIVFVKEDEQGRMTHSLMFLPDEENILMPVYIKFDENEIPSYMSFMDNEIYIDGYTESTVDFTLAVKDAVWSVKDVPCSELVPYSLQTRAWADNNGIRNACAIGNCIVGAVDIGLGVLLIGGAVVVEGGSVGLATPAAVPTIAAGLVQIGAGCKSLYDGFSTIFGPADQKRDPYIANMIIDSSLEGLAQFLEHIEVKENPIIQNFPKEITEEAKLSGKIGLASFIAGMSIAAIDAKWGKIYTGPATLAEVHQEVQVVTGRADNVTEHSAELYGYVSPAATAPFGEKICTEIYIVLWKVSDKSIRKHYSTYYSDGGIISFIFSGLESGTTYCYQTLFQDVENGYHRYGEVKEFKTKEEPDERWVDLGLSVLWAAYNVGATSPEEYGGYYAWGETEEKRRYIWENYKYCKYYDPMGSIICANIGSDISGTEYDVAHVKWGNGARMPTLAEVKELIGNCTFTGGSYNGVRGSYVTGPNGNSIFFPFAGYPLGGGLYDEGSGGYFWSGTYYDFDYLGDFAYGLNCSGDSGYWDFYIRYGGRSVRPVTEK